MSTLRVQLQRYASNKEVTIGGFYIDCKGECFTLEDEFRSVKKWGDTRIPSGSYEIKLRCEGGHYERYLKKYPDVHKDRRYGMLCITNADNWKLINKGLEFQFILIHILNSDDGTAGCVGTGSSANHPNIFKGKSARIQESTRAYKKLYPKMAEPLLNGDKVFIDVYDEGQMF